MSEGANTVQNTNPAFNGITPALYGNNVQSHPAGPGWNAPSTNSSYFLDGRPFNGGPLSGSPSTPATPVSGSLWKFSGAQLLQLHRKLAATLATSGYKGLIDVSSPATGNIIGGTAADNYKYCVANVAGECVTGSAVGDVYNTLASPSC